MRRAQWWTAIGCLALGAVGLACSRSMGQEPGPGDPPRSSLQLRPIEPAQPQHGSSAAPSDDPFAPISVEELLPASQNAPTSPWPSAGQGDMRYGSPGVTPSGAYAAPAAMNQHAGAMAPPAPIATLSGGVMAGALDPTQSWSLHGAVHGPCPMCGGKTGCCGGEWNSMLDGMVLFAGADYWSNAGELDRGHLVTVAAGLNVEPVRIPNLDPARVGGFLGINVGIPLTPDGELFWQLGTQYVEEGDGAQGFFTLGAFHRATPGDPWGINWGMVYDVMYDDFIDYSIGQLRFKMGYPITARDEIGGWFTVGTNVDNIEVTVVTEILGIGPPTFDDILGARVRPMSQGHLFWHHIFECGADMTWWCGGREDLGGAFVTGATVNLPLVECWSIFAGGHATRHTDNGSYDVYMGLAFYPGGKSKAPNSCGTKFMPYQDVANNTWMPISIDPRFLELRATGLKGRL